MTTRRRALLALLLAAASGCGRDEILHGVDEPQANQVVVALADAGISASTRREDGSDGLWRVEVAPGDVPAAQRLLSERGLPRRPQPGFGEVFGKGSMVPTPGEERALYLHALSGELARTVEAIDGVVEARVHLALAPQDALRSEPAPPARAAVLVKVRPGARPRVEPLAPGIQSLVAGAVSGLDASSVAVVIAESAGAAQPRATGSARRAALIGIAAVLALAALLVPALLFARRLLPPAGLAALVRSRERAP